MKKVVVLLAVALVAVPVLAGQIVPADAGRPIFSRGVTSGSGLQRTDVVYSNITVGPTAGFAPLNSPVNEIGDDLTMTAGGMLDSLQFSVYNSSTSGGALSTADLTLNFYDADYSDPANPVLTLAGTLSYPGTDLALPVGYYSTFEITGISADQSIILSSDIVATLTVSNVTGGATKIGQVMMDPPTVGSSTDNFYMNGSWYYFGGDPVANMYWEVGVVPVPEPAALGLLALGGVLIRRR